MKKFFTLKFLGSVFKFGLGSIIATAVEFLLFVFVFSNILPSFTAYLAAAAIGISVNFIIQKTFIFEAKRKLSTIFFLSISASILTTLVGAYLIDFFIKELSVMVSWPQKWIDTICMIAVTGIRFVLNFFSKKYIFEKKWID